MVCQVLQENLAAKVHLAEMEPTVKRDHMVMLVRPGPLDFQDHVDLQEKKVAQERLDQKDTRECLAILATKVR